MSDSPHDLAIIDQAPFTIHLGATTQQLAETIFAYPTLSDATGSTCGQATHSMRR